MCKNALERPALVHDAVAVEPIEVGGDILIAPAFLDYVPTAVVVVLAGIGP